MQSESPSPISEKDDKKPTALPQPAVEKKEESAVRRPSHEKGPAPPPPPLQTQHSQVVNTFLVALNLREIFRKKTKVRHLNHPPITCLLRHRSKNRQPPQRRLPKWRFLHPHLQLCQATSPYLPHLLRQSHLQTLPLK